MEMEDITIHLMNKQQVIMKPTITMMMINHGLMTMMPLFNND